MGLHKDTFHHHRQGSGCTSSSTKSSHEKIIPIKAKHTNTKWEKKIHSEKTGAFTEVVKKDTLLRTISFLTRRSSLDNVTLAALRGPIQDFPLDSIIESDDDNSLPDLEDDWTGYLDPFAMSTLQEPVVGDFPLESLPDYSAESPSSIPAGWTATWFD